MRARVCVVPHLSWLVTQDCLSMSNTIYVTDYSCLLMPLFVFLLWILRNVTIKEINLWIRFTSLLLGTKEKSISNLEFKSIKSYEIREWIYELGISLFYERRKINFVWWDKTSQLNLQHSVLEILIKLKYLFRLCLVFKKY